MPALLIRGPGIRVPSSAPKETHDLPLETRYKSWAFLFLYAENGPENATKTRQIRKNFRKQDLACRSKNPPTIFDVNSQKTVGLCSDDENFAGGHKKSAATLKHKMERSEILTG